MKTLKFSVEKITRILTETKMFIQLKKFKYLLFIFGILFLVFILSSCFKPTTNQNISFTFSGTVSDITNSAKLSGVLVYCNLMDMNNDVVNTIQATTNSEGFFDMQMKYSTASSTAITGYEISFSKTGYEVYTSQGNISDNVTINADLEPILANSSQILSNGQVSLPNGLTNQVVRSLSISGNVPIQQGQFITPVFSNSLTIGSLLTKDGRTVGMWMSNGSGEITVNATETVIAMCAEILKILGFSLNMSNVSTNSTKTLSGYDILSKMEDSQDFSTLVQTYENDSTAPNYDLYRDETLTNEEMGYLYNQIKIGPTSPSYEYNYISVEASITSDGSWTFNFGNKFGPEYLVAALSDGSPIGILDEGNMDASSYGLEFWNWNFSPKTTILKTSHFFNEYFYPKTVYVFSGIALNGNAFKYLPVDSNSPLYQSFFDYDYLAAMLNLATFYLNLGQL
jgi:hypothetical protein